MCSHDGICDWCPKPSTKKHRTTGKCWNAEGKHQHRYFFCSRKCLTRFLVANLTD